MTSKHTPGPWILTGTPDSYFGICGNWGGSPGPTMFELHPTTYLARDTIDANARLIAEAPAMLEALRELEAAITFSSAPEIHVKGRIVNRISALLSRIDGKE